MLIECQCGNKLRIKDSLTGKKVRCPRCQSVFVAQEQERGAQQEERVVAGKTLTERTTDEENVLRFDQDEPSEKDDAEELESSRGKSKKSAAVKAALPAWRKWGSVGLLGMLVLVLGVVFWRFWYRGTLELGISGDPVGTEVFIDGTKYVVKEDMVILSLAPGEHKIKVTKADHKDFTKEIKVEAFKEQRVLAVLESTKPGAQPPANRGPIRPLRPGVPAAGK